MTPYGAAKILNEVLKAVDLPPVPPQMIYNYCKKGFIKSTRDEGNKIVVDEENFQEWSRKYLAKKGVEILEEESTECEGQLSLV